MNKRMQTNSDTLVLVILNTAVALLPLVICEVSFLSDHTDVVKKSSKSNSKNQDIEYQPEVRDTLGRSCKLGQVYDINKEEFLSSIFLIENAENAIKKNKPYQNFDIIADNSIQDKMAGLDIGAHLTAQIMGGKIEIEGSGGYLSNYKRNEHIARVTLAYKSTTHYEELRMEDIFKYNMYNFENFIKPANATHVITKILYGANANFIFDQKHTDEENKQSIDARLKLRVANLGGIIEQISGEAFVNLEGYTRSKNSTIDITYYGDVNIGSLPSTYNESVKVFKQLPNRVTNNNSIPLKMWLYPIHLIINSDKYQKLAGEIEGKYIEQLTKIMDDMMEMKIKAHDILEVTLKNTKSSSIETFLEQFKNSVKSYLAMIQLDFADIIPGIRKGTRKKSEIGNIISTAQEFRNPFYKLHLEKWLNTKRIEGSVLKVFRQNTNMAISPNTLKAGFDRVVITLNYQLYYENDPYVEKMRNFLNLNKTISHNFNDKNVDAYITIHDFDSWKNQFDTESVYGNLLLFRHWAELSAKNPRVVVTVNEKVMQKTTEKPEIALDIAKAGYHILQNISNPINYLSRNNNLTFSTINWPDTSEFTGEYLLIRSKIDNGTMQFNCDGVYRQKKYNESSKELLNEWNQVFRVGGLTDICTLSYEVPKLFVPKSVKGYVEDNKLLNVPTWVIKHRKSPSKEKDEPYYIMKVRKRDNKPDPWAEDYELVHRWLKNEYKCVQYNINEQDYSNTCCSDEITENDSCVQVINL